MWFQIWHEEFGKFSSNHSNVQKFHSNGLVLSKIYEVWAKKIQRSASVMVLNSDGKFEKPWPCDFKNGMKNWVNFHYLSTQKSENCTLMGSFCPKHKFLPLETFREIMSHDTGVAKFKQKLTCGLKNDIRNLVNFYASSWKSKNWHFDWIRLSKVYKYLDENVQKSYVSWNWRVM